MRFQARINDIVFDCETLEDSFEKAIARHEYPYRPGALLEDMGQKARSIKLRCYFLNDSYERHTALIDAIKQTGHTDELEHPAYGIVTGTVESMVVRHDDRERTAEIDLTFIEERTSGAAALSPSAGAGTEEAWITGQTELADEMKADIREQFPGDFEELLKAIDPTQTTLFTQYSGLTRAARAYVKQVDRYVARLSAVLNHITSPANSLTSTTNYAGNLVGVTLSSLSGAVERHSILCDTLRDSPGRFLDSFRTGISEIETEYDNFGKYTAIAASQREAVEVGAMLEADQDTAQEAQREASTVAFSSLGYLQRELTGSTSTLTITEIENALAAVRSDLQDAIDTARGMRSLKTMAAILTEYVIAIKKAKPPLATVHIDVPLPLHAVCLTYGLSCNEADQLMAINRIPNPNATAGEVQVYVR